MNNRRNYYRILQVQPDAPLEIIRASYRTLMRELKQHPDLGGDNFNASLLNEAYETLSDPARRAAYDEKIEVHRFARGKKRSEGDGAASSAAVNPAAANFSTAQCPFCKTHLKDYVTAGGLCPKCKTPLPESKKGDSNDTNRRALARIKRKSSISFSCSWQEGPQKGIMIDLSLDGMRFLCSKKLKPGTVLRIATPQFTACGLVTNLHIENANSKMPYSVGVSFVSIDFEETKGAFISLSG
jgi:curved DNA-binding protein CbpA